MCCYWASSALLQHALQLLLVLLFHGGQQQKEAFLPAAALRVCRSSLPLVGQRVFFAPETSGVSQEGDFRASPAALAAEARFSAMQRTNSTRTGARIHLLHCYTSPTSAEKIVSAPQSDLIASAAASKSLLSRKATELAETADFFWRPWGTGDSVSPKHAIDVRAAKSYVPASYGCKSSVALLYNTKTSLEKVKLYTASTAATDSTEYNYRKQCSIPVGRQPQRASQPFKAASGARGASGKAGHELFSAPAAADTRIQSSRAGELASFPALILSYVAYAETLRLGALSLLSTSLPFANKEVFGAFPLWTKTGPFLAAVLSLIGTRHSIDQQQQRLLSHARKIHRSKRSNCCGSRFESSGKASLLLRTAVPIASLISCNRCPVSATRTAKDDLISAPTSALPVVRSHVAAARNPVGRVTWASAACCRADRLERATAASPASSRDLPSHGKDGAAPADGLSESAKVDSLLEQKFDGGLLAKFSKIHRRMIEPSPPSPTISSSQVPVKQPADCAAEFTSTAARKTPPQTSVKALREVRVALTRVAASVAAGAYLNLMLSLTGCCQAKRAEAPLEVCNSAGAAAEKQTCATTATGKVHQKTATAAASLLCTPSHVAPLAAQLPQRSRRHGRTDNSKEAVEAGDVTPVGLQRCDKEQKNSSNSLKYVNDDSTKETRISCKQIVLRSRAREVMKHSVAWLFWRVKEKGKDEDTHDQKKSDDNRKTDPASGVLDGGVLAAPDQEKELFEQTSEEVRRQAFRSPVVSAVLHFWNETPKFTRFYLTGAFTLSLLSFLYGQSYPRVFSPNALLFDNAAIREKKQFYRLITSLFYFGPLSLPALLSLSFVHAYLGGLEQHFQRLEESSSASFTDSPDRSHPLHSRRLSFRRRLLSVFSSSSPRRMFPRLLLSSAAAAMTLAALQQIPNEHLLQCISTSLLHVWSRLFPSGEADFYGLFTISNEYLPFFFLAQNWLLEGRIVAADLYGIGIAAVWLLFVQRILEEQQQQHEGPQGEPPPQHPRT